MIDDAHHGSGVAARVLAAILETEQLARAATPRPWRRCTRYSAGGCDCLSRNETTWCIDPYTLGFPDTDHIVHHNSAAVLRRCAADREIVDSYEFTVRICEETAARIRAQRPFPALEDLQTWSRANYEIGILRPVIELLAKGYDVRVDQ